MKTQEQLKKTFIDLVRSISVEGADIDGLLKYLEEKTDFYTAPASAQYHCSYEGGLLAHSLNVYYQMEDLYNLISKNKKLPYSLNSVKLVGLFHDLSKTNLYEKYISNKKVYSENGSKYDAVGNYDWVSQEAYKIKDSASRDTYGSKVEPFVILSMFFPLNKEEIKALISSRYDTLDYTTCKELPIILNSSSLTVLVQCADLIASYITENTRIRENVEHCQ